MQVSVTEAHRLTGVARSTIYKDIDAGKLSVSQDARGRKRIMVAELQRVYGELDLGDTRDPSESERDGAGGAERSRRDTPLQNDQVAVLQERIESLRGKVEDLDDLIGDLKTERTRSRELYEEHIEGLREALAKAQDGYNTATKLLEDKSSPGGAGGLEKTVRALESRLENQERAAKSRTEREDKILRQNRMLKQALDQERSKSKSFFKKLFG